MEIKEVDLNQLRIFGTDLKLSEDSMQIWKIADSIKEYGQLVPIICYQIYGEDYLFILDGSLIFKALRCLNRQKALVLNVGVRTREDALKIWFALNFNQRPINYIEVAKIIKAMPEIKNSLAKQTVLLQEEIDSLEKILDFDWSCFAKAKQQAEGPDMFGGLFDEN